MTVNTDTNFPIRLSKLEDKEEFSFQPVDMEGTEDFKVWDNTERKFLKLGDKLQTSTGEVEITKYFTTKQMNDEEKTRWRRAPSYIRKVIINGEQKELDLTFSTEKQVREKMETCKGFGKDPKAFMYIITREIGGSGFPQYYVKVGQPLSEEDLKTQRTVLSNKEKELVDVIQGDETANGRSREEKVELFIKNGVCDKTRAEEIVNSHF